jgi:hypothetical protein
MLTVLDLRFMTAFGPGTPEERTGRARLELFAPDSLVWTEVEPPAALAQVPVSATLLRQPEPVGATVDRAQTRARFLVHDRPLAPRRRSSKGV